LKQLRGAARLVKCEPVAALAGAPGGFLRAAREGKAELSPLALDWVRYAVATLAGALATDDESFAPWAEGAKPTLASTVEAFTRAANAKREEPHPPALAEPTPP